MKKNYYQYDMAGRCIGTFRSLRELEKKTGICRKIAAKNINSGQITENKFATLNDTLVFDNPETVTMIIHKYGYKDGVLFTKL